MTMHKIVNGQRVDLTQAEVEAFEAASETAPSPRRVGTPREFLALFTATEWGNFHTLRQSSSEMDLWLSKAVSGDFSLDHPDVSVGLSALVSAGVITTAREVEILSTDFDTVENTE